MRGEGRNKDVKSQAQKKVPTWSGGQSSANVLRQTPSRMLGYIRKGKYKLDLGVRRNRLVIAALDQAAAITGGSVV